ncbi:MAG: tetratricopeptide repeat protein [Terracidiphilus sp.]
MRRTPWIVTSFVLCLTVASDAQTPGNPASSKMHELLLIQRAEKGDANAQAEVVRRAEKGDSQAESALGDNYEYGFWVPKDHAAALRWYRKAAEQGDPAAREIIGQMYFDGKGVKQDFTEAAHWFGCPKPSDAILSACTETNYQDLPPGVVNLLDKMKCDSNETLSAIDLTGSGSPVYEVCCSEAPHGPCGAVLIGKIGEEWKELSPKEGLQGFYGACNGLIVLDSQHNGFHDICLPNACSAPIRNNQCVAPAIWQFNTGRYHSVAIAASKTAQ